MTIGFLIKPDSKWHTKNPKAGETTTFSCLFGIEEARIRFSIEVVVDQEETSLTLLTGVVDSGNRKASIIYNKSTGGGAGLFL